MRKPVVSGYDGVYDKFLPDSGQGGTVEWQPGDGTRYLLVAKALAYDEARLLGATEGAMIVAVGTGGERWVTLILTPYQLHHLSYVAEKAQGYAVSEYTVIACTVLLNLVLGDEAYGVQLFDQHVRR